MKQICFIITVFSLFFLRTVSIDASDITQTINSSVTSLVERYTALYGVSNDKMMKVIKCESQYHTDAYNPKDSDGLPKYGLLQFGKSTFKQHATEIGIQDQDIWNPEQQIQVASYMWTLKGGKEQWGCYH